MERGRDRHVRILIKGKKVQHVGYRLFVAQLALRERLRQFNISNVPEGVEILVGDETERIDRFYDSLKTKAPPHAEGAGAIQRHRHPLARRIREVRLSGSSCRNYF